MTCDDCRDDTANAARGHGDRVTLCPLHSTTDDLLNAAEAIVEVIIFNGDWADRGGWLDDLEKAIAKTRGATS